jgi:glycosyltransferase involved in cell wall biosynthesis
VRSRDLSILLVHGNSEWYGSDRAFFLQAINLSSSGWNVFVALPAKGVLYERCVDAGITPLLLDPAPLRVRVFGSRDLLRYALVELPRAVARCRRTFRRFDLVDLNTSILLGGIFGALLARRPAVLHVRETYAGSERLWSAYCTIVGPAVARVVATSTDIAAEVRPRRMAAKTVVVPDGLDFGPVGPPPGVSRRVVTIGRINAWKGQGVLIEAIALVRARGIDVTLDIAGDEYPGQHDLVGALERQIDDLDLHDAVRLLGYVDDVDGLLADGPIVVVPSTRPEPFGLALVDAMGRGLACIATDAGGPREIVRHDRTGLLVPPRDAVALADAIERLLSDDELRHALGAAAAADVRTRFSIEETVRRLGDVYVAAKGAY